MSESTLDLVAAMLIRADAAHALLERREIEGIDALCMVVAPTDDVLNASLKVCGKKYPHARKLIKQEKNESDGKGTRPPRRSQRSSVSLDELLLKI